MSALRRQSNDCNITTSLRASSGFGKDRTRALSAAIAAASLALLCCTTPAAAQDTVRLGVSAILSGPLSLLGQQTREGAELAVDEINAAGGLLSKRVRLFVADNACDPAQGINAAGSLVSKDNVAAFIGSGCSSVTLAVMPILRREEIVQLEFIGTNPKITETAGTGGNPWQYRLNIDDAIMAEALSAYIADQVKSIAIVARNDDYGRGAAAAFESFLEPKGVRITSTDFLATGTVDYRPTLTKIKGDNPAALLVIYDAPDAGPIARQYTELGMTQKIFGRGTVVTPQFQALVKDPAIWNRALEVNRWAPNNGSKSFQESYEKKYGVPPELTAAMAYYGIHTLAEAVKLAGSDDRVAVRDALKKLDIKFDGLGPIKFDDHNQAHPDMFVIQWQDGNIVTLDRRSTQ